MSARDVATPLPLVRVAAFLPFVNFLAEMGSPTGRLLHCAGLPVRALENPETLISLRYSCRFLERAARHEGIPTLGFRVGLRTPPEQLGSFGLLVRRSVTLWDALCTAQRLISTMNSGFRLRYERQGDLVWIHHEPRVPRHCVSDQADAYGLALIVSLIRTATSNTWCPDQIGLRMLPDSDWRGFVPFSSATLRFGLPSSAIAVPVSLLSQPLGIMNPPQDAPQETVARRLQASAPASDLAGSVSQFIRSQLTDSPPDIRVTAEAAGLSVRTLQRQLAEQGSAFARLLEQARFSRAVELLRDTPCKIVDVAQELGYGDTANFTRAFRRWAGVSPREFRRFRVG